MIALKKFYGDELLRLALVLSLLKADPNEFLESETQQLMAGLHGANGSDWSLENEPSALIRPRYVHPKSLDNVLINYEREIFDELNSLGRYNSYTENNDRIFNGNRPIHTYLVNVATETVGPSLADPEVPEAAQNAENDQVSADDNVAEEVKVFDEETEETPDAVVTLTPGFLENRTGEIADIFEEITTRSFDVNEFLVSPDEMLLREDDLNVDVKKERREDLYDDNAIDEFVPYFATKTEKFEIGEPHSVFDQNMADLQDYGDFFDVKELRSDLEFLDGKQQQGDLEQFLLENTPLELDDDYGLAPLFDEKLIVKRERASTSVTSYASSSGVSEMDSGLVDSDVKLEPDEGHHSGDELTQEDMDLIEVLWKQDVDMGFSLDSPLQPVAPSATKVAEAETELKLDSNTIEEKGIEKVKESLLGDAKEDDPWAGLSYTVDTETGEYVLQGDLPSELVSESSRLDLLEEALQLVDAGDSLDAAIDDTQEPPLEGAGATSEMLHPAMTRHMPHHLHHYHNQRWQDLASLLTIPPPPEQYQHYHHPQHTHNISAHGAAGYAPNYPIATHAHVPEKHPDTYGASAPPLDGAYKVESHHHHPQQHDGLYYQNTTAEAMGNSSEGFLQSILNDEDLQLMDMAMNEGMYTMRILDGGGPAATHHHAAPHNHTHMMMTAERDSASDSAVSSMGSERVPSLSDGEWCDGSDSAQEFHSSKFRPYDNSSFARDRGSGSQPQKKHHMFGKRCFQEQPPPAVEAPAARAHSVIKYECAEQTPVYSGDMLMHNQFAPRVPPPAPHHMPPPLELNAHAHNAHALIQPGVTPPLPVQPRYAYAAPERVRHNHTYSAPPAPAHDARAHTRDKRVRRLTDGSVSDAGSTASHGHLSRDEKRAKALGIPIEVQEIINLPMDEFNERLSKHDLSEAQLSLIRDIRRRGKNKVAAQNCRKRKLDQITSLADEVRTVRDRKQRTLRDRQTLTAERQRVKERFAALYRHVFQHLRDADGRPLSSAQYSLQQAADGNVVLVPKMPHHSDQPMSRADEEMDRKAKSFDQ